MVWFNIIIQTNHTHTNHIWLKRLANSKQPIIRQLKIKNWFHSCCNSAYYSTNNGVRFFCEKATESNCCIFFRMDSCVLLFDCSFCTLGGNQCNICIVLTAVRCCCSFIYFCSTLKWERVEIVFLCQKPPLPCLVSWQHSVGQYFYIFLCDFCSFCPNC